MHNSRYYSREELLSTIRDVAEDAEGRILALMERLLDASCAKMLHDVTHGRPTSNGSSPIVGGPFDESGLEVGPGGSEPGPGPGGPDGEGRARQGRIARQALLAAYAHKTKVSKAKRAARRKRRSTRRRRR